MNKTKRFLISMLTLLCCCTGAWAEGELNGVFTISTGGGKVQFSQGNLQYQASTNTWRFAANQYDYIGNAAGNTSPSSSQTAWIDYFNWGTSGYNHGANCYQPWSTSKNRSDYYAYGSGSKNLYDAKDDNSMRGQADWGYNAISNGGNTEKSGWRILTKDEWAYLINSRSDTYRYAKGTIYGTNGLMLFPDGFTLPTGVSISNANTSNASYTSYSDETWASLEAAGVVFLPATGLRNGTTVMESGTVGNYWSSTCMNANSVYNIRFDGSSLKLENDGDRQNGFPVRLVKDYALQQDASGNYLIGSVQDWKEFADIVNSGTNTAANAKMTADIDLGDDQTYISPTWYGEFSDKHYHGTFDGQGHTLTVHYNSSNMWHTPFSQTSGATIKNLHVAGTITSTSSGASHMSGLISNSAGNDVIENVWVSADITGGNNSWIECGAFVGCNNCGNTTITDCLFTGSITTTGGNNGCFAGYNQGYQNSTITTNNCLSTGTFNFTSGGVSVGTINNSYVKSYPNSIPADMQVTDAQLTDGTTTANLQAGRSEVVWVQDPVTNQPMLATFANAVTLTDGDDLTALSAYAGKACKVAYSRSFTAGKSSTICLPFAFAKGSVGTFYTFTGITHEGSNYEATMTEYTGDNLVPNTPYLFTPSTTGSVDFGGTYTLPASITAGSTVSGDWTYLGTYETIEWTTAPTGIYGFSAQAVGDIQQGEFVKVGAYVRIKPMRCYLKYKNGTENYVGAPGMNRAAGEELPETIKVRLISANGEVTAIGTLQTTTGEVTFDKDAWYSLDGRRIEGKPSKKGIYVNNGKKILIK